MDLEQGTLMRRSCLAIVLLLMYVPAWGATYYVDATSGNDSNPGTATNNAWKTISRVNTSTFSAGDSILFKRGGTWREQLTVSSSGSAGNPITFGTYGTGADPIITGTNLVKPGTSWADHGANIWKATGITTEPRVVLFNRDVGNKKTAATLISAKDWYLESNILYVYSTSDPDTAYTNPGIEIGQRDHVVYSTGKSYYSIKNLHTLGSNKYNVYIDDTSSNIELNGVTVKGSHSLGLVHHSLDTVSYVTIDGCTFAYNGAVGIFITAKSNNWLVQNNTLYNNGFTYETSGDNLWGAGIYMSQDTNTKLNIIQNNEVYYTGYKDSGTTRVKDANVKGFGIWMDTNNAGSFANANIVRYNKVHHNADSGLYSEKSQYGLWYYNLSYSNGEYGLRIDADVNGPPVANNRFYNNTIYGNNNGIYASGGWGTTRNNCYNNTIQNNISIGNTARQLIAKWGCENDGVYGYGNVYTYNSFGAQSLNFIEWGNGIYKSNYDAWETAYGSITNSIEATPTFASSSTPDFHLKADSSGINAGTDVGLHKDYAGNPVPRESAPDIGAYEFNPLSAAPAAPSNLSVH